VLASLEFNADRDRPLCGFDFDHSNISKCLADTDKSEVAKKPSDFFELHQSLSGVFARMPSLSDLYRLPPNIAN
jgi:hypothetical protein